MADFSKQWCDQNNEQQIKSDFDILEIADGLQNEYYTSIICEGYGFIAIGKNKEGEIILAMPKNSEEIEWKLFNEVVI